MIDFLINMISVLVRVIVLLVIVKIILSYFMDPNHPIRQTIDNLIDPMLVPIRRVVPLIGMFDFSSLILIIGLQILGNALISVLFALR